MAEIDLPLIRGKVPLTLNQRLHWREKARRTAIVVNAVWATAKQLHLGQHQHINVRLHFATGDNRRRDQDNLVATLKPCLDGLVRAGVIPDDTPNHVTWWSPEIHNGPGKRRLWLEINPTETQ
ncbi:MAG: hypothetical protein QJR12_16790 [Mycobacterium sp.]|uniref:hypothetical protein n=1 Tax=Mycobacterium sp. TaxID=1785 RepID=UPI00262BC039|nr:hypothetical protein [Mycobacterium sp.]MDI3315864.1 hypothetical protein [Mycobacterium sp.]